MCTLVVAWRCLADAPVVVAANRDERFDRESLPPAVRTSDRRGRRVLAPRDAEAGGTWIGVNEDGVVAALTNRWLDDDLPADRSRGLLLGDALECASATAAARRVERAVRRDRYDGFNVVLADADDALLCEWDGRLRARGFDPGVHVVTNTGADGEYDVPERRAAPARRQVASAKRATAELRPRDGETAASWRGRAAAVLGDHGYDFCVHGDGFGTRSSSLITVDGSGGVRFDHADGPPCETGYRRVDGQL